jgi:GR25 family glycosyltransferase involved in LPS biosynthesis
LGIYKTDRIDPAACATVSHALLWKRILDNKETAIILEHDAVMLQPVDVDIPDHKIVVLGYKLKDISRYNHLKAGKPKDILDIDGHEGAHAYAITWKTAELMLQELQSNGISLPIDNSFFLKMRKSKIPLSIMSPTPAIGWLRKSTIWDESSEINYDFIDSFRYNLL